MVSFLGAVLEGRRVGVAEMRDWKTTASAVATAFFAFVAFSPQWFHPLVVDLAKYAAVGGLAVFGVMAKDGGQPPQQR